MNSWTESSWSVGTGGTANHNSNNGQNLLKDLKARANGHAPMARERGSNKAENIFSSHKIPGTCLE